MVPVEAGARCARVELRLHASCDFEYAIIIGSLGFVTWRFALEHAREHGTLNATSVVAIVPCSVVACARSRAQRDHGLVGTITTATTITTM